MKNVLAFSALLLCLILSTAADGFSATRTWTGATSSNWQVASNWSGGIPGAGDVAQFNQTGSNRNITNVPTTTIQRIVVATTGAAVSYSFTSTSARTITLGGGAGTDLSVAANCELIINSNVTLTIGGNLTALISGNMVMEGTLRDNTSGTFVVNGTFHMNGTITMTNNRTITGTGTWFVDATKTMTVSSGGNRLTLQISNITNNGTITVSNNGEIRAQPGTAMTSSATSAVNLVGNGIFRTTGTCSVANVTGAATSRLRSAGGTLTVTGTSSISGILEVSGGATMIINGNVTVNTGGTLTHSGTLTINANRTLTSNVSFTSGNNTTMNVNGILSLGTGVTWTMNNAGATCTVSSTGNITGAGNMTHTLGSLTVNGLITVGGNFSNASPLTGVGTIEIGGTFTNSSTMFVYPGVPPGKIISGYTWRGLTSTAWATATNWWAGVVPVSTGDAVIYNATNLPAISTAGQNCRRLYIHNDASLVTISPAGQLTASGKTTLGGGGGGGTPKLLIQSTSAGTGSFIDNGTFDGVGTVTMQRFLSYGTSGLWHYICVPMTQINAWTYFDQYMKYYSESTHHFKYVIAPADSTLNSDGLGYAMWPRYADWTAVQTGIPNTGTLYIPVSRTYDTGTADYDGWNLVGNPYTSALDLSGPMLTGSANIDATAWFWDPSAGNYTVYPLGGGGSHSQFCPPGQGFFVHCNDASATPSTPGTGALTLTNVARVHNGEAFLKETMANILKINVVGSPNEFKDELSVYFNDAMTAGYDRGFDALKMDGIANAPQIYTVMEGNNLAVNALASYEPSIAIPMSFKAGLFGSYMLTAGEIESFSTDVGISLEDLKTGTVQDLRKNPDYTFTHDPANLPERFLLRFNNGALSDKDPAVDPSKEFTIYSFGNTVYVRHNKSSNVDVMGNVSVFDLLGREVFHARLECNLLSGYSVNLPEGYYVVSVRTQETVINQKVYLD
jgi:hypothetical protein